MRRVTALLLACSFGFSVAGCDKLKGDKKKDDAREEEEEKKEKKEKKAAAASASAEAPKAEPPNPNDAFFTIREEKGESLHRIRAGKVTKLAPGDCSYIEDLAIDKEGRAWLRCLGKVFKSEGDALVQAGEITSLNQIAVGRDGSVWAGGGSPDKLYKLEKGAWKEIKAPEGLDGTWDLAVDDKGKAWVSTKGAVWVREGDAWQPAPLGNDKPEDSYPSKVVPTDDGTVFVLTDKMSFVGIENGKPGSRTFPNFQEPVARPGGGVLIVNSMGYGASIVLYDAKGSQQKTITPGDKVFLDAHSSSESKRLTADRKGRVWIGTIYGLIVADADGSVQQLEPGRVPGVVGANVERVVVAGDGPELPKLGDKVRGGVKGKVNNVDKPTQIELCAGFSSGFDGKFYGPTPCSGQPVNRSVKTDKDGNFELKDVPPYPMTLLIQTGATSWVRRDPKCCDELKTGETKDIGAFDP